MGKVHELPDNVRTEFREEDLDNLQTEHWFATCNSGETGYGNTEFNALWNLASTLSRILEFYKSEYYRDMPR